MKKKTRVRSKGRCERKRQFQEPEGHLTKLLGSSSFWQPAGPPQRGRREGRAGEGHTLTHADTRTHVHTRRGHGQRRPLEGRTAATTRVRNQLAAATSQPPASQPDDQIPCPVVDMVLLAQNKFLQSLYCCCWRWALLLVGVCGIALANNAVGKRESARQRHLCDCRPGRGGSALPRVP